MSSSAALLFRNRCTGRTGQLLPPAHSHPDACSVKRNVIHWPFDHHASWTSEEGRLRRLAPAPDPPSEGAA